MLLVRAGRLNVWAVCDEFDFKTKLIKEDHMENETLVIILAALLAVSEALALIPALKSNSVLQFIINTTKKFLPAKKDPAA